MHTKNLYPYKTFLVIDMNMPFSISLLFLTNYCFDWCNSHLHYLMPIWRFTHQFPQLKSTLSVHITEIRYHYQRKHYMHTFVRSFCRKCIKIYTKTDEREYTNKITHHVFPSQRNYLMRFVFASISTNSVNSIWNTQKRNGSQCSVVLYCIV